MKESIMNSVRRYVQSNPVVLVLIGALVVTLVAILIRGGLGHGPRYVTGMVEVKHVDVAAKIPARIGCFLVEEGKAVRQGDVLLNFENREIAAKVEQARGAMSAAEARYAMALHGARLEEVEMALKAYKQAEWNEEIMKKTFDRVRSLHEEGVVSNQQWDEVDYRYRAAVEMREAAYQRYVMVKNGARPEEKDAAKGLFMQAKNAMAEAESYLDETTLRAPIAGIVERKIVEAGEIVAAGYPLLSLVDPDEWWVIVNVNERETPALPVGSTVECRVPALGKQTLRCTVARVNVLSDFATKKATTESDSFDSRTFEVKLIPVDKSVRLYQGSTVLVPVAQCE
jgi:HlyD family secretion protein